jgi:hypothetical protein
MTEQEARRLKPGQIITYIPSHLDYHLILEVTTEIKSQCLWSGENAHYVGNIYYTKFHDLHFYRIEDDPEVKAKYL